MALVGINGVINGATQAEGAAAGVGNFIIH